jgi:hypothetical protein
MNGYLPVESCDQIEFGDLQSLQFRVFQNTMLRIFTKFYGMSWSITENPTFYKIINRFVGFVSFFGKLRNLSFNTSTSFRLWTFLMLWSQRCARAANFRESALSPVICKVMKSLIRKAYSAFNLTAGYRRLGHVQPARQLHHSCKAFWKSGESRVKCDAIIEPDSTAGEDWIYEFMTLFKTNGWCLEIQRESAGRESLTSLE